MGSFKKWMVKYNPFFRGMSQNTIYGGLNLKPYRKTRHSQTIIQLIGRDFCSVGADFQSAITTFERSSECQTGQK
jgi:hypothetical protein